LKCKVVVKIGNELRIRVMIVKPNEEPYIDKIWNELETLRKEVGEEKIEVAEYEDILVVFNPRGLVDNIPINRYIDGLAIRGTFLITNNNKKEMDFDSLTKEQIDKYMEMFSLEREEEFEL